MSSILSRGLHVLELLTNHPAGLPLHAIADELGIPRSNTHRILADLVTAGFVKQAEEFMPYRLTLKLATLGLHYFTATGVAEIVQPVLNRLAQESGELARMSMVENDKLIWIAKAQGAKGGLRFDAASDPGEDVRLCCSSNGMAWLSTLSDEKALELVSRQGFIGEGEYGPNAPRTVVSIIERLHLARSQGYATACETYEIGTSAIAAPIRKSNRGAIGAVSIAGPAARMTPARLDELAPLVMQAAHELSAVSDSIMAAAH